MNVLRPSVSLQIPCILVTALAIALPADAQVTAADVVDRSSLRAFVERDHAYAESALSGATEALAFFDREFRPQGERKHGSIYTGVILDRALQSWYSADPTRQHLDAREFLARLSVRRGRQ